MGVGHKAATAVTQQIVTTADDCTAPEMHSSSAVGIWVIASDSLLAVEWITLNVTKTLWFVLFQSSQVWGVH